MKGKSIKIFLEFSFSTSMPILSYFINIVILWYGSIRKLCQLAGWEEELNQMYSEIVSSDVTS
jgi:hypothetical protein